MSHTQKRAIPFLICVLVRQIKYQLFLSKSQQATPIFQHQGIMLPSSQFYSLLDIQDNAGHRPRQIYVINYDIYGRV